MRTYDYIVVRIGDKYYSTNEKMPVKTEGTMFARNTQKGEYIKGKFCETNNHKKIEEIDFQIDLYWEKEAKE